MSRRGSVARIYIARTIYRVAAYGAKTDGLRKGIQTGVVDSIHLPAAEEDSGNRADCTDRPPDGEGEQKRHDQIFPPTVAVGWTDESRAGGYPPEPTGQQGDQDHLGAVRN